VVAPIAVAAEEVGPWVVSIFVVVIKEAVVCR